MNALDDSSHQASIQSLLQVHLLDWLHCLPLGQLNLQLTDSGVGLSTKCSKCSFMLSSLIINSFQCSLIRWVRDGESSVLLLEVVHHARDGHLAVGGEVDGGQFGGESVHAPEMPLDLALKSHKGVALLGRDLGCQSSEVNCRSCNTGGRVEGHLRSVNALPAELPAIDFSAYSKVTVPGMVDNFQKKYGALTIPYPSDQGTLKAIDDQAAEHKA